MGQAGIGKLRRDSHANRLVQPYGHPIDADAIGDEARSIVGLHDAFPQATLCKLREAPDYIWRYLGTCHDLE
jgi:hypothetical protein